MSIGELKRIDPREVWDNEGTFSDGLADNLGRVGDKLHMSLERSEREKSIGRYSADIICHDSLNDVSVVIENQFTKTDHDHLGKMITYAGGVSAKVVIWVSPYFHEEHRAAIEWLNEVSGEDIGFFGITLEIFQIGDSDFAPYFKISAQPNDWRRRLSGSSGSSRKSPLTESELRMAAFWDDVRAVINVEQVDLVPRDTKHGNWLMFGLGAKFNWMRIVFDSEHSSYKVEVVLYGRKRNPSYSTKWFDFLQASRNEIEAEIGDKLVWTPPTQNVEVSIHFPANEINLDQEEKWPEHIKQMLDCAVRLDRAFRPRILEFVENEGLPSDTSIA